MTVPRPKTTWRQSVKFWKSPRTDTGDTHACVRITYRMRVYNINNCTEVIPWTKRSYQKQRPMIMQQSTYVVRYY